MSVYLAGDVQVRELAYETLGHVALSPAGGFIALQGADEIRLVRPDGRVTYRVRQVGYRNEVFWLDDRHLLTYTDHSSLMLDAGGRSFALLSCDGRPAELPALLNRLPDGGTEIIDDRGSVLVWDSAAARLSCG